MCPVGTFPIAINLGAGLLKIVTCVTPPIAGAIVVGSLTLAALRLLKRAPTPTRASA